MRKTTTETFFFFRSRNSLLLREMDLSQRPMEASCTINTCKERRHHTKHVLKALILLCVSHHSFTQGADGARQKKSPRHDGADDAARRALGSAGEVGPNESDAVDELLL